MDAKTMVSHLILKLQNLFPKDEGLMNLNQRTRKQVETAINNLQLWKRCLKDDDHSTNDQQRIVQLLQAYYKAEDAIDTLTTTNKLYGYSHVRWPLKGFQVLCLEFFFTNRMRKFKNAVRDLPSYDRQLEADEAAKKDVENADDTGHSSTKSLSSGTGEPSQQQRWGRISDLYLEEEMMIVGRERETNELLLRLIPQGDVKKDNDRDDSTKVIALIGKRGSGKTTLARSVYNRVDVKMHFSKRAWVHIPSVFKVRNALADILIQIGRQPILKMEAKRLSEEELMRRITRVLEGSRFLIVMERVDETSHELWESVIGYFCSSTQRGIIIITACTTDYKVLKEVAYSALHVRGLNNEDSWKLFVKKARTEALSDSVKHEIEETILKICSSLPSQIVLLGCVLATRESKENYSLSLFRSHVTDRNILSLCYEELPPQLKICFLYMGIFPREYEIPVRRLIHLWCAEGFVTPLGSKERVPEVLAETYFEELAIRNMIQVVRWRLDGLPKTCRMPGLFYDFLSPKAADIGFFYHDQLHSFQIRATGPPQFPVRWLAADVGSKNNVPSSSLHLRSYIAFDRRIRGTPATREMDMILQKIIDSERKGFGILKVLDLEGVYKPQIPKAVAAQLPLLRYLGLRSTSVESLPDVKLSYLETLDVRHTKVSQLPSSLRPKRHLYMNWFNVQWNLQDSDVELQTLWGVYVVDATDLNKFRSLRRLGLKYNKTSTEQNIADYLPQPTQLQSLKLILERKDGELPRNIFEKMAEHPKLQELYLHGNLPSNTVNSFPPNLTTLTLSQSNLENDPMPVLEKLKHLKILRLFGDSYKGKTITCSSGGFPKLQVLKLWKLTRLESLTVEEGAMPCLRVIETRSCRNLLLPGLEYVRTLREFVSTNMPPHFGDYVEEIVGRDVYVENNEWNPHHSQEDE